MSGFFPAAVEACKGAFREVNSVSKSTTAVSNALRDAAYRWEELKDEATGGVRFPLFLQILCAPMIGFQLEDETQMEVRIIAKERSIAEREGKGGLDAGTTFLDAGEDDEENEDALVRTETSAGPRAGYGHNRT